MLLSTCKELEGVLGDDMKLGYYRFLGTNDFINCIRLRGDCKDVVGEDAKIVLPSGGVFDIYSEAARREVEVVCDLRTDGGGWTVFQRRKDGSVDFYRDWDDYVNGFGNKDGEFWLGLETIYQLTKNGSHELRVDLTDWSGNTAYAKYGTFSISSRDNNYRLTVEDYSGTAGNGLGRHNLQQFSTKDADHDSWGGHCAQKFKGGWWFFNCLDSDLNGLYNKEAGTGATGVTWYKWRNRYEYLKFAEMKFRRKE